MPDKRNPPQYMRTNAPSDLSHRHRRCATSDLPSCLLTRSAIKPPIHPVLPPKIRTFVMGVGSVEEDMVEHVVEEKWRWRLGNGHSGAGWGLCYLFARTLMWQNGMVVKKKGKVVKKKAFTFRPAGGYRPTGRYTHVFSRLPVYR